MDNPDNRVGLLLALSSSAFIGSSFIIKKKGLIRSRASGQSAGDGGYAYLKESLWWIGLLTMVGGEVANFAAYAFAPAILVTPLGALSVLVSAILADRMLNEKLLLLGKVGCVLCILGSTVIVLNAPEEQQVDSVKQITDQMFSNGAFQAYAIAVVVASLYLIYVVAPRHGKRNIFVYVTICSIVGSLSVIGVKGLGIALKLTFSGNNQLGYGSTWGFVALVAVSVVTQMNYLNMALDTFNTALVTPIYYVIFTTATITASAILFEGWSTAACSAVAGPSEHYSGPTAPPPLGRRDTEVSDRWVENMFVPREATTPTPADEADCQGGDFGAVPLLTCLCGFLTICCGVLLLHLSREEAQRQASEASADAPGGPPGLIQSPSGSREGIMMSTFSEPAILEEDSDSDNDMRRLLPR